jgi:hypothetical protein
MKGSGVSVLMDDKIILLTINIMRLLHTATLQLHEGEHTKFREDGYAVLSHRWGPNEITLHQFESHAEQLKSDTGESSPQLDKIRGACETAHSKDIRWLWIDSCCIDKRDLVETTEAINSMYKWYHNSALCIVYLHDVKKDDSGARGIADAQIFKRLGQDGPSEWWSRGWTLQELLAPLELEFYDKDWAYMGTRTELKSPIRNITGIDERYLTGEVDFRTACIAQKMSWIAGRITTREEDIAYCMVGIFGVALTPIYGEGLRAFTRLQEALLSSNCMDESLFAWKMPAPNVGRRYHRTGASWNADEWGLLAPSPEWFAGSGNIKTFDHCPPRMGLFTVEPNGIRAPMGRNIRTAEYELMARLGALGCLCGVLPGILPMVRAVKIHDRIENEDYCFKLNCYERDGPDTTWYTRVGIYLRPMKSPKAGHYPTSDQEKVTSYTRVRCTELGRGTKNNSYLTIGFVPQPTLADS